MDQVISKLIDGKTVSFYRLSVLDEGGAELFVPVDKAKLVGLRLLVSFKEVSRILKKLIEVTTFADGWKERACDNVRLFNSGSAFDLALLVKSLTEMSTRKSLSTGECKMLLKARSLLVREICEVTGETEQHVEQRIDSALTSSTAAPSIRRSGTASAAR
jgi:RNA polymerase-interacting CarD/CdnL/TRCF family regulator